MSAHLVLLEFVGVEVTAVPLTPLLSQVDSWVLLRVSRIDAIANVTVYATGRSEESTS